MQYLSCRLGDYAILEHTAIPLLKLWHTSIFVTTAATRKITLTNPHLLTFVLSS